MYDAGQDVPDELFPPVDPFAGYESWLEEFWELGTERQLGQTVGPIPASAIRERCREMPEDQQELFFKVMRALDRTYLHGGKSTKTFSKEAFNEAVGARK